MFHGNISTQLKHPLIFKLSPALADRQAESPGFAIVSTQNASFVPCTPSGNA